MGLGRFGAAVPEKDYCQVVANGYNNSWVATLRFWAPRLVRLRRRFNHCSNSKETRMLARKTSFCTKPFF